MQNATESAGTASPNLNTSARLPSKQTSCDLNGVNRAVQEWMAKVINCPQRGTSPDAWRVARLGSTAGGGKADIGRGRTAPRQTRKTQDTATSPGFRPTFFGIPSFGSMAKKRQHPVIDGTPENAIDRGDPFS